MKQFYTLVIAVTFTTVAQAQTWTKVSGIMDSSQIKGIGEINNQILVAGQNWGSNTLTDYAVSNDGGNTWSKLPTYQFAGFLPNALPQNNLMICSNGFTFTKKLDGSTWQSFAGANNFAEFSNGSIIGSAGSYPDSVYSFSAAGVRGAKLGNYKFKLSPKYCNGANNRLFLFAYGAGLAYIDYSNLSVINFPATLDGVAMTEASWQGKNVVDMVQTSNGNLFAVDNLGYGIFKSTDNGVNWTTVYSQSGTSIPTIAKNANDDLFILAGNAEVRKSTDGGVTWTNISGNLPPTSAFKVELFVNSSNDLFCLINKNGAINPNNSGIYKLASTNAINDIATNNTMKIYPNPSNGTFTILSTLVGKTLIITDVAGKQVYNTTLISVTQQINAELNAGVYFVKVGNTKTQKLIVE
jgi:photosystem II stability/assembly factor-like uncharacterized protein